MLFTPLWFWGLCREIQSWVVGARVTGGQVTEKRLRLALARNGEFYQLSLWLDARFPRAECSPQRFEGALSSDWSVLDGAVCTAVEQPAFDRRLQFGFAQGERVFDLDYYGYGRPAAILRDAESEVQAVLGSMRKPGAAATLPFVLDMGEPPAAPPGEHGDVASWLSRSVRGLDGFWIAAAMQAAGLREHAPATDVETLRTAWGYISRWAEVVRTRPVEGYVIVDDEEPVGLALLDLGRWLPYRFERAPSLSAASALLVRDRRVSDTRDTQQRSDLARAVAAQTKLARRLAALEGDREQQIEYRLWQENADWLTAHLSQVRQGETTLQVATATGERTVELDPAVKPSTLADRWYRRARRLRRGLAATEERIQSARRDLSALDELVRTAREALSSSGVPSDLPFENIRAALGDSTAARAGRKDAPSQPFRRFRSPGGMAIWVGRSNRENDELTMHHAHRRDLWFHAQQAPGSHVVLRSHVQKDAPARADVLAAAATAAFFSKARHSARVPVIYTEARYVRKPRNAPPGRVRVEREKSLLVEPAIPPLWNEPNS